MEVILWWMAGVWLLLIAAAAVIAVLRGRRGSDAGEPIPVAHAERLTALPGYRRAMARYRALLIGLASALVVALLASIALTLRFSTVSVEHTDLSNRDIVLCLDVSGSMIDYDTEVIDVFSELAEKFEGERLSLVIFNASAVTYFPLTSDVEYIQQQFDRIQGEFESDDQKFYSGTLVGNGSSLVGDGLASCAVRFDSPDEVRSRNVILVTDNLVAGESIFSLADAGALATDRGIRVYGVNPGDTTAKDYLAALADEFKRVVLDTGGGYYALADPGTIPAIVDQITSQQAAASTGPTSVVSTDRPELAAWVLLVALVALFGLAWRLRR